MENLKNKKVAELVTNNINTADIFKKNGIDFCCGGGVTIEEACKRNNLSVDQVVEEINSLNTSQTKYDYAAWPLDFLAKHIEFVHHQYVENNIPIINQYLDKVTKVHGNSSTELFEINSIFKDLSAELTSHLKKEELILFPFVEQLEKAKKNGKEIERPHFGSAENPIAMMEQEHESAGDAFKEIAQLTNGYQPPDHACNTFKALYHKLDEFEQDLHLHIHLENNILFPKAIQLEKQVFS